MPRPRKSSPPAALSSLVKLGKKGIVYLNKKASEAGLGRMQAAAKRDLGEGLPEGYVALLRLSNGVQINGAYFKEAENLVAENLDLAQPDVIVLGLDGGLAEYIFDKRDRRFHIVQFGFPDERSASFDTFDELLGAVLREQGVV